MSLIDNLFRWLGFGRYNSTPPTVTDGAVEELQIDSSGRLKVALDSMTGGLTGSYHASPTPVSDGQTVDVLTDNAGRIEVVETRYADRPGSGASGATARQTLANGTGSVESTNSTAFTVGDFASIRVGATPIRIVFLAAAGGGSAVAATDELLPAYGYYRWLVSARDAHVAIEAGDTSSAYEAWVWTSSGPRATS